MSLVGGTVFWQWCQQQRTSRIRRDRLQRLAFSGLSAQLVAVERTGPERYQGTIAVENLEASQSLYLLPLDVQLYIQQGSRWNPFPARWSDNQQHVLAVEGLRPLNFDFSDTPSTSSAYVGVGCGWSHRNLCRVAVSSIRYS